MKFLFSFFLIALFSYQTLAQGLEQSARIQGVTILADSMDRDNENEIVELNGNIQIVYQNQHLRATRARINFRSKSIDAIGNVVVTTPQATIAGSRVILDYESSTGVIIDGYVQSGNVLFEGSQIQKISETEYIANDAKYTTCTTCPEAWSFSGSRIRADMGGYAYIKNSFMRVADVPIFWLPYMIVPLKSDRQSGILTPGFEVSDSGGIAYSQSYFWAMSRSQDSTWTLKNYELRGLKGLLNYRYVLTEDSSGELDLGYLRDRVFAESGRLNKFRSQDALNTSVDRYFVKYSHYYEMPEGITHRAQLNNASDLQYPIDFAEETQNNGDSAMENRMSVTKNTNSQHFSVDTSYYINLQQANPLGGNDDSVHRLPEVRFSQAQSKIGSSDFLYSFDLDYVNFARPGFAYDNLVTSPQGIKYISSAGTSPICSTPDWETDPTCYATRDGTYDADDLIRTGQRLDLKPTIYRPIKLENLDLLPRLTYRETQYTFPVGDNPHSTRRYIRADMSARTTFSRIYGDFSKLQSERIKHEIQPEVSATTIPWLDHPQHDFFGDFEADEVPYSSQESVSDADLNGPAGLQWDYTDRLYDRKLITFGFTNKLTRKIWTQGAPEYLQFVNWRLAQSYDVYQSERNPDSQPLSDLLSDLKIKLKYFDVYQRANYYPYQKVTNTSTRVRVNNDKGDFFQVEHLHTYEISPGQDVDFNRQTEEYTFSLKKSVNWVDLVGRFNYSVNSKQGDQINYLKSWGYGAQFKVPGDCLYFDVTHYRVTGGDNNFKFNIAFVWDGQAKPPISDNLLDTFGF